jgi:hypothetical protein
MKSKVKSNFLYTLRENESSVGGAFPRRKFSKELEAHNTQRSL